MIGDAIATVVIAVSVVILILMAIYDLPGKAIHTSTGVYRGSPWDDLREWWRKRGQVKWHKNP